MEKKLFEMISEQFPSLDLVANDKMLLNGMEIDIAIPSLKLGVEWNGIVHFKPIYGDNKLSIIQQRDAEKQQRATDLGINLVVVPDLVSTDKYLKEAFQHIRKIIESRMSGGVGFEPTTFCLKNK